VSGGGVEGVAFNGRAESTPERYPVYYKSIAEQTLP
jgi:hypothetical protein